MSCNHSISSERQLKFNSPDLKIVLKKLDLENVGPNWQLNFTENNNLKMQQNCDNANEEMHVEEIEDENLKNQSMEGSSSRIKPMHLKNCTINLYNSSLTDENLTKPSSMEGCSSRIRPMKLKNYTINLNNNSLLTLNNNNDHFVPVKKSDNKFLPLLKNGSVDTQYSFRISKGERIHTFENTCAIDSIFQIILNAAKNWPSFEKFIERNKCNENSFLRMAAVLFPRYEVTAKEEILELYRLRAETMRKYLTKDGEVITNSKIIDCKTSVQKLYEYLFKLYPSVTRHMRCNNYNCSITTQSQNFIHFCVSINDLINKKKFSDILGTHFLTKKCRKCQHPQEIIDIKLGNLICFEILNENGTKIFLNQIPGQLLGFFEANYVLCGIIEYSGPTIFCSNDVYGHYSAICLSYSNSKKLWIQYDDLHQFPTVPSPKRKFKPTLAFYVRSH